MKKFLICGALLLPPIACAGAENPDWSDPHYDFRVRLQFAEPIIGRVEVILPIHQVIKELGKVSSEPADFRRFAFETCVVQDPATGEKVGEFEIVPESENLVRNAGYQIVDGKMADWAGYQKGTIKVAKREINGQSQTVLELKAPDPASPQISQMITLTPGQLYVLDWLSWSETGDEGATVALSDPAKRLFADHQESYTPKLQPIGQWRRNLRLHDITIAEGKLALSNHSPGQSALSEVSLRKAQWRLRVNLPRPVQNLDVYFTGRGGHRLTTLRPDDLGQEEDGWKALTPARWELQARSHNASGYRADLPGLSMWSLPPEAPLRSDRIPQWRPPAATASEAAQVILPRGGAFSLLLVLDSGTPYLKTSAFSLSDCPVEWQVTRLAPLGVYDGPFPHGRFTQVRFDPMVPPEASFFPPSPDGLHVLCVTFRAPEDAPAGTKRCTLTMKVSDPVPRRQEVKIPIDLTVLSPVIRPMKHFSAMFGNQLMFFKYPLGDPFSEEQISMAEYHGFSNEGGTWDDVAMKASVPQYDRPERKPVRDLVRKYNEVLLDHHILPKIPQYESPFTYEITRDASGKISLTNFQFEIFNEALKKQVAERDARWFCLAHTNGFLMDKLWLSDGKTYSFQDPPEGKKEEWVKLSRDEYFVLVGQYYEALAANLEKLGILDRAFIVVDECDDTTYETIKDYIKALKSQPLARKISFGHTTYHGEFFSHREGGQFLMDTLFDVPMPINDEHFNYFEPEYLTRFRPRPAGSNWVYYVSTDHWDLDYAGLSTVLTPLELAKFGRDGWYCWAAMAWSLPYAYPEPGDFMPEGTGGPVVNPWLNPYYHHGPGVVSFFYPPDPRGLPEAFTDMVTPSYRLALMREGFELRALIEVLKKGVDDAGQPVRVDQEKLETALSELDRLWYGQPTQWRISYGGYEHARDLLRQSLTP